MRPQMPCLCVGHIYYQPTESCTQRRPQGMEYVYKLMQKALRKKKKKKKDK